MVDAAAVARAGNHTTTTRVVASLRPVFPFRLGPGAWRYRPPVTAAPLELPAVSP
jgi:hypothetical protein